MVADLVLGVGGFILAGSLLPSFKYGNRPSLFTSTVCSVVLFGFVLAYAEQHLYLGMVSAFVNCAMWLALVVLKSSE